MYIMDYHQLCLERLCRRCKAILPRASRPIPKSQKSRPVKELSAKIKHAFGIDVSEDDKYIHPSNICMSCIRKVNHATRNEQYRERYLLEPKVEWSRHPRTGDCHTCNQLRNANTGGNKYKAKPKHLLNPLPFLVSSPNIFTADNDNETELQTREIKEVNLKDEVKHLYTCGICKLIYNKPVYTMCHHTFCGPCLTKKFQNLRSSNIPCPYQSCNETLQFNQISSLPHPLLIHYNNLEFQCSNCKLSNPLHTAHTCHPNPLPSPTTTSAAILTKLAMQHKSDEPVPEPVAEAVGAWVSLMLAKQRMIELKSKPTSKKVGILYDVKK